jgi:hypothetical protein
LNAEPTPKTSKSKKMIDIKSKIMCNMFAIKDIHVKKSLRSLRLCEKNTFQRGLNVEYPINFSLSSVIDLL